MNLMPIDAEFCGECGPTPPDTKRTDEEKAKARTKRYYATSGTMSDNAANEVGSK